MTEFTHQLVVQFAGDDITDFDSMIELEDDLMSGLGDKHLVDGHDVGSGEVNIFVLTTDPDIACAEVKDLLSDDQKRVAKIAFRSVASDDYKVLWPPGLDKFSIT